MITIKETPVNYILLINWNVKYGYTADHPDTMESEAMSYTQAKFLEELILSKWRKNEIMRVAYGDEVFDVDCNKTAPAFEIVEV